MRITAAVFPMVLLATMLGGAVRAVDVDVDIGLGAHRPRTVVVPAAPVVERYWVPEKVVRRTEKVMVEPPHLEKRTEQICVQPAQVIKKEERVLIQPPRVERVKETVLVQPEHIGREWVPPVTEDVKIGPVRLTRTIQDGYWREVKVPAEYRTVYREVEAPARYEVVTRNIEVPARYETVVREFQVPGKYREITRDEVVPGHWEERVVTPQAAPVIVAPPRPALDIDIDLGGRKR